MCECLFRVYWTIVDVEAIPAYRTDEVNATKTMIDRVEERFDMKPERLVGDTAYDTAEMLARAIRPDKNQPQDQSKFAAVS